MSTTHALVTKIQSPSVDLIHFATCEMKQENEIKTINYTYIIEIWNIPASKILFGDSEQQRIK